MKFRNRCTSTSGKNKNVAQLLRLRSLENDCLITRKGFILRVINSGVTDKQLPPYGREILIVPKSKLRNPQFRYFRKKVLTSRQWSQLGKLPRLKYPRFQTQGQMQAGPVVKTRFNAARVDCMATTICSKPPKPLNKAPFKIGHLKKVPLVDFNQEQKSHTRSPIIRQFLLPILEARPH